jgi:hypothetical protein
MYFGKHQTSSGCARHRIASGQTDYMPHTELMTSGRTDGHIVSVQVAAVAAEAGCAAAAAISASAHYPVHVGQQHSISAVRPTHYCDFWPIAVQSYACSEHTGWRQDALGRLHAWTQCAKMCCMTSAKLTV